jgi:hypothetical protein
MDVPWVFHDEEGHRWPDIRHAFDRACRHAGIVDFHFHDLRHTFASWLAMRGVPLATVSSLLGHTTPTMTLRYAHLSPKHLTSAVRVLDPQTDGSLDTYLTIQQKQPSSAPSPEVPNQTHKTDNQLTELNKKDGAEAGS